MSLHRGERRLVRLLAILASLALMLLPGTAMAHGGSASGAPASTANSAFCSRLGKSIQASSGAQMYCFGPQQNGAKPQAAPAATTSTAFSRNVDAGNPQEDITPAGVQAYGQSEVSTAATGPYVVEAWNDATGFFAPCPSPGFKEELTGFGFSANSGASFKDQGGLPNDCTTGFRYEGDPSVETWRPGGIAYFYISSLYISLTTGQSDLALDACKATGTGSSAIIACAFPTIVATGGPTDFLDKEFLTIDPVRGRLYMSYTRFGAFGTPTANGQIELAVCDIGSSTGGTGPAGGSAGSPVCFPGASTAPYYIVAPGNANCENEGAYPAVNLNNGDVYVAWEFNWATNFETAACAGTPTTNNVARVPSACLTLTPVSPCTTTPLTAQVSIVSMDAAFIPGYNRFPANDFPRIAVSMQYGTVSIVWNDARFHPLGDILLQSFNVGTLQPVQTSPVRLNTLSNGGLHFLPALRNANSAGHLNVSFYQRGDEDTAITNVFAALDLNPRMTGTPTSNVRVTDVSSNWDNVSSDIIPNFGDYTDNYVIATASGTHTGHELFVAWSDGRIGDPQPYNAHGATS